MSKAFLVETNTEAVCLHDRRTKVVRYHARTSHRVISVTEPCDDQISGKDLVSPKFIEVFKGDISGIRVLELGSPNVPKPDDASSLIGVVATCQRATKGAVGNVDDKTP